MGRVLPFLLGAPGLVYAQPVMAQAPTRRRGRGGGAQRRSEQTTPWPQLDQMLAPIALYPDQLLTKC